jgi:ATP-dependent Lon protease
MPRPKKAGESLDRPAPDAPEAPAAAPAPRADAPPRPARRPAAGPRRHARPDTPIEISGPAGLEPAPPAPGAGATSRPLADPPPIALPVVPLRDMVIFPHMVTQLFVGRDISLRAVAEAVGSDRRIIAVAQREPDVDDVTGADLYPVGVEVAIGRVLKMPDGTTALLAQGQQRVEVLGYRQTRPYLLADAQPIREPAARTPPAEAGMRAVLALFEKIVKMSRDLPEEAYVAARNVEEPGALADLVASSAPLGTAQRQEILSMRDPAERLQALALMLAKAADVLDVESHIETAVQKEVDKTQREYYLREQLKAILHELGEEDPQARETRDLRARIEAAGMPEDAQAKALEELERLQLMPPMAPEVGMIRTYLDWLIALPWAQQTTDHLQIADAARTLEANHYGLPKVKERILEYMAVRRLAQGVMRSPILCFVGPPGVGKTSLGRSIAQALGRKFVRVSLGGIRDEAEIRGHRRTYVGALPGRILQTMRTAGTINPVFMLDEIDKLGADFRGDPAAALLEVLDPEQNHAFSDHYLDVPYDLSRVLFIMTANLLDPVPDALLDRMEVIELPGYIEEEKFHIARRFLVPRQIAEHGLLLPQAQFTDGALYTIIREYTHEAGLRNLEREIGAICRKLAREVVEALPPDEPETADAEQDAGAAPRLDDGGRAPAPRGRRRRARSLIRERDLETFLGPPRFSWGVAERTDEVGLATGLSWTPVGGDTMGIEVTLMEGRGALLLTGQLGEVMKESAQAGLSYARSWARRYGVDPARFEKLDIHIHVPAGATPKDGPSAGVTMTAALISALTRRPVRRDVAMTGEITLRGRVLPVGGLKEKVLAAHRAGITTMIAPRQNAKDLVEIPARVRRQMQFTLVDEMSEVVAAALLPDPAPPAEAATPPALEPTRA